MPSAISAIAVARSCRRARLGFGRSGHLSIGRAAGFTLLELMYVTVLVSILFAIFLERMSRYQEYAEMTVMETTVRNIQSGIRWHVAQLMTEDRMDEADDIPRQNPVKWLDIAPMDYIGAFNTPTQQRIPEGSWYFDTSRMELVYVPRLKRFIEQPSGDDKSIRFKVIAKIPASTGPDGNRYAQGIEIIKLTPYRWFPNGF